MQYRKKGIWNWAPENVETISELKNLLGSQIFFPKILLCFARCKDSWLPALLSSSSLSRTMLPSLYTWNRSRVPAWIDPPPMSGSCSCSDVFSLYIEMVAQSGVVSKIKWRDLNAKVTYRAKQLREPRNVHVNYTKNDNWTAHCFVPHQ